MNEQAIAGYSREIGGPNHKIEVFFDPFNLRLRVDDYQGDPAAIALRVTELAREQRFTKAFVKARETDWRSFLSRGFVLEGVFEGYFSGQDAFCMSCYLSDERRRSDEGEKEDDILRQVLQLPIKLPVAALPPGYTLRKAEAGEAEKLAKLYGGVFRVYPTPMDDPDYIAKVMKEGTVFFAIEMADQIVSAASAEINLKYGNAEMTDCATLPEHREHGFMKVLLMTLEEELRQRSIHGLYSLARAQSFGMNAVLHQLGYEYAGRLTKNCCIYDSLEDMNLWVKPR